MTTQTIQSWPAKTKTNKKKKGTATTPKPPKEPRHKSLASVPKRQPVPHSTVPTEPGHRSSGDFPPRGTYRNGDHRLKSCGDENAFFPV